jgi:hypothetical protein
MKTGDIPNWWRGSWWSKYQQCMMEWTTRVQVSSTQASCWSIWRRQPQHLPIYRCLHIISSKKKPAKLYSVPTKCYDWWIADQNWNTDAPGNRLDPPREEELNRSGYCGLWRFLLISRSDVVSGGRKAHDDQRLYSIVRYWVIWIVLKKGSYQRQTLEI